MEVANIMKAELIMPSQSEWRVWGPYLSERQWGTVREDNSYDGNCWDYFPRNHAVFRAYTSGDDGLLGFSDHQGALSLSLALSNGKDPFLKERLFGLSSPEGNHGEDVKELYYYCDGTPTHSLMRALYRYPQQPFPYQLLIDQNKIRSSEDPEFEILETGVFDKGDYWDINVEFAKRSPVSIVCRYSLHNRSSQAEEIFILPQVWFRNTWTERNDENIKMPQIKQTGETEVELIHKNLGEYKMKFMEATSNEEDCNSVTGLKPTLLFTNNETNETLMCEDFTTTTIGLQTKPTKEFFHRYVQATTIQGQPVPKNLPTLGTKCAGFYQLKVPPGGTAIVRWQLSCDSGHQSEWLSVKDIDLVFQQRLKEADELYSEIIPKSCSKEESSIIRQAFAGLLWSKQFYCYNVQERLQMKETLDEFKKRTKTAQLSHSTSDSPVCKKRKLDTPTGPSKDEMFKDSTLQSANADENVVEETVLKQGENIVENLKKLTPQASSPNTTLTLNPCENVAKSMEMVMTQSIKELDVLESVERKECEVKTFSRNEEWKNLNNDHVISMPDKWEFPWYAVWDLAFHMIPFTRIDPEFSKSQLLLFLSDGYMHPSGKIPAYEFNFNDVNPPVHAWGCWGLYVKTGRTDQDFLRKCFHKLLINYTWWFNQRRSDTQYLYGGGFLGLDNISVLDRSSGVPTGWYLDQADGTGWMAFYSLTMLKISIELAKFDPVYFDLIPRFLGNFLRICKDLNQTVDDGGLWDEATGFYYDVLRSPTEYKVVAVRSLVGIIPLTACCVFSVSDLDEVKSADDQSVLELFKTTMKENHDHTEIKDGQVFLSAVGRKRIPKILSYLENSEEFLSPFGIRSLSKVYEENPFILKVDQESYKMEFCPGESNSCMFGGNSNWRGPIYFSVNYLILETLTTIHSYYGDENLSINGESLADFVADIRRRLVSIFLPDEKGRRPCHGANYQYSREEGWKDKVLFYEYFHSETGRGCGARNQTGWTALVIELIIDSHGL